MVEEQLSPRRAALRPARKGAAGQERAGPSPSETRLFWGQTPLR